MSSTLHEFYAEMLSDSPSKVESGPKMKASVNTYGLQSGTLEQLLSVLFPPDFKIRQSKHCYRTTV